MKDQSIFYFTAKERRAFLILLSILGLVLLLRRSLRTSYVPKDPYIHFDEKINAYLDSLAEKEMSKALKTNDHGLSKVQQVAVKPFHVNEVTERELISYGLSPSVAKAWVNYREAKKGFRKMQELASIYGMDSVWLRRNAAKMKFDQTPVLRPKYSGDRSITFDPNNASEQTLAKVGFSKKAIRQFQRFRKKGGRFHQKSDVAKLFGVDQEFYRLVKDQIEIVPVSEKRADHSAEDIPKAIHSNAQQPLSIDINGANAYQWQLLPGIGPGYASRIIRFRQALGGFISKAQVAETYGLPDTVFNKIKPYLALNLPPKKIQINHADLSQLGGHPYLSHKKARIMINYRDNHGPFFSPDDIFSMRIFDTSEVQRLLPYLSFE